jgi:hypothetical protein
MKPKQLIFTRLQLPPGTAMLDMQRLSRKISVQKTKDPVSRLGVLNRILRVNTYMDTAEHPWAGRTPRHLHCFANEIPASLMQQAQTEMVQYFEDIKSPNNAMHAKTCFFAERGLTFSPSNKATEYDKSGQAMLIQEFREVLRKGYPGLYKMWGVYERELEKLLHLPEAQLEKRGQLMFIRYTSENGLWTHIDNVRRSDGFVVSVGVGVPVVFDMAPSLLSREPDVGKKGFVLRTHLDAGDMLILDGEARMEWSHAIPFGRHEEKYTMLFLCNHISPACDHYNKDILERVYTSVP